MKNHAEQKPPKRVKIKRRLTLVLAVMIALIIAFVVLTKSRLVPYQVSKYVNRHLLEDTRFDFSCGKVTGDLVRNVVLHDPVIRYHGPDASYNVFRADEISINYSLTGVLRMNLVIHDLRLRNVGLRVRQSEDGRIVLPVPVKSEITKSAGPFAPRVDVERFLIDGLQLHFGGGGRELAVRDVNLEGSYKLEGGVGRLQIDRGNAFIVDSETPIESVEMDIYHEKDSVRIRDFSMRVGRSFIMSNGGFEGGRFERLQFIFNPVILGELHSLGLIPDLQGELAGNVVVNGAVDSLRLDGTVTGSCFGLVMNSMNFDATIAGEEAVFDTLWGGVYGTEVGGKFRYGWGTKKGFAYEGDFRGLDLREGFLPDSGLPEMDIYGNGSLVYDGKSRYEISARSDSTRIDRYRAGKVDFEAAWVDDVGLLIDQLRLERPGYTVDVSGRIDAAGRMDAVFDAKGTDLSYFWDYVSLPPISGKVAVGGKLSGPIRNLQINLNGTIEDIGFLFAGIDSASIQAEVRGVGGDDLSATVDVRGKSVSLWHRWFEFPHLLMDVVGGTAFVRDFSFSKGDSFVTSDFDVTTREDETTILLKHIAVDLASQQWRNENVSTLVVGEGKLHLDSLALASGQSVIRFGGVYSERDESLQFVARGRDFELTLLRDALDLPLRMEGRGEFRAEIDGDIANPGVELTAELKRGAIDSLEFDSMRLRAGYDRDRWNLHDLLVVTDGDSLSGTGWWAFGESPVAIFAGRGDVRRGFDRQFYVDVTSRHYPVPAVMKAIHAPNYVEGAFSGTAALRNTFVDPYVTIAGKLDPRSDGDEGEVTAEYPTASRLWAPLTLPPTDIRIEHRDGTVRVPQVTVGGGVNATISGELPVRLNLLKGLEPRADDPLLMKLSLNSTSISPLIAYTTHLAQVDGSAQGEVTLSGTLADPKFTGSVSLDDCTVRFTDVDETYSGIHATLEFRDSVIALTSFEGESRGAVAFSGSGTARFVGFRLPDYRLQMDLSEFWIRRRPDFEALVDGHLTVTTYQDGVRSIPEIKGSLTLKQAEIVFSFDSFGKGASSATLPTATPGWICSIDITAHNNLWVRNPDMNVELAGQLILKRDQQGIYLRGDLNALRGSYTVYNNKFYVTEGTLDFSAAEGFRPEVYISAYTPHRVENGRERRIYLTLTWPRDKIEPEIQLSYDEPGYYESDLWRMLGGTDIAGDLAANTLEKLLNQQMSGMTVYVDREATGRGASGDPEQQMMIGVGKYLWEDLYLTYRQGLTLTADQAVEVEYRLKNMIYIRSGVIRHTNPRYYGSILRSVDEYNLDVKFRWEY
jgi:hypothetical protein